MRSGSPAPGGSGEPGTAGPPDLLAGIAEALRDNLARGFLESEERFRQIADALLDIVSLSDLTMTKVFFVSAAYDRIWGRPREALYSTPLAFLDGVHPDDRDRVRDAVLHPPPQAYDLEFRVLRPDGDQRWVWHRGFPVRDASGEVYRIAGITEDITERKQIADSHERLIRGFTHDVKNPLAAADGYLALLEEGLYGEIPAKQAESIGRARHLIHNALGLVLQLLEIEMAQAGQLTLERAHVNIGALSRQLFKEFRGAATARQLDLSLVEGADDTDVTIETDPERLRQILGNLISNATKYTQSGGWITIRSSVADEDGPSTGRWVTVAVADNGPGIPFEKQNLLFREFTRFQPNAADGTGLGLAISQRLARALGGAITFKSTPGGGSTFTVWLPADTTTPSPVGPVTPGRS